MPAGQFSKDPSVDRALRHSVRDGMAYSVQVGAGETYFSAFALFLNATAQQIALVSTLPQLLGSSAQIFSAWLGGYAGRRRVVLLGCALQALLWLPILLVPLLFRQYAVTGLLALLALYFSANNLAAPQWTSIMRDLVSERSRTGIRSARRQSYWAEQDRCDPCPAHSPPRRDVEPAWLRSAGCAIGAGCAIRCWYRCWYGDLVEPGNLGAAALTAS